MRKQLRKLLGLALSLAMCLSLVPATANAAGGNVEINAANFPDPTFRAYVQTLPGAEDGVFTPAELAAIDAVECGYKDIHSLEGSQYFTEITVIQCPNNALTSLDLSHFPKLDFLYCPYNQLTSLDFSHNPKLREVICERNQLTFLDVSHCPELDELSCSFSKLPSLDLSHNPKLGQVYCAYNQITSLDVSHNPELFVVECSGNRLTHLKIDKKLSSMQCRESECEVQDHTPLSQLPGPGFDKTRVRNLKGGNFNGNRVNFTADRITYTYNFGHGYSDTFTLIRKAGLFSDVFEWDWFFKPVEWAVANKITGGVGNGKFGPNQPCTRAQIVTFLWNKAGQPEPQTKVSPFTDVSEKDWFFKPVMWAVENKITSGVGGGLFAPEQTCTREQAMTLLWVANGRPGASAGGSFTDVPAGSWYYEPVRWAVEHKITDGIGGGLFGTGEPCTRAQIVTFLYRV